MSMDFRKNTYRPKRPDNRFRTSYSQMSQWMAKTQRQNSGLPNLPDPMKDVRPVDRSLDLIPFGSAPLPGAGIAAIEDDVAPHLRYSNNAGYDDYHRAFRAISNHWPSTSYPVFGPPRLRHGRAGGSWRHVKEVLQAGGSRIVFVDGQIRYEDNIRIDDVPGGHVIQPDARNRGSNRSGLIQGYTVYDMCPHLSSRQGIEQNNWNVIR